MHGFSSSVVTARNMFSVKTRYDKKSRGLVIVCNPCMSHFPPWSSLTGRLGKASLSSSSHHQSKVARHLREPVFVASYCSPRVELDSSTFISLSFERNNGGEDGGDLVAGRCVGSESRHQSAHHPPLVRTKTREKKSYHAKAYHARSTTQEMPFVMHARLFRAAGSLSALGERTHTPETEIYGDNGKFLDFLILLILFGQLPRVMRCGGKPQSPM